MFEIRTSTDFRHPKLFGFQMCVQYLKVILEKLNGAKHNGSIDAFGPRDLGSNPGWSAVIEFKLIFVRSNVLYKSYDQSDNRL